MSLASLQDTLQKEQESFRALQKEISKNIETRQQFTQQLTENDMVKKELDMLDDEARVFKLVGPVLIKQDHAEAASNVSKRLEFIKKELERLDGHIKSLDTKAMDKQKEMIKLQKRIVELGGGKAAPAQ